MKVNGNRSTAGRLFLIVAAVLVPVSPCAAAGADWFSWDYPDPASEAVELDPKMDSVGPAIRKVDLESAPIAFQDAATLDYGPHHVLVLDASGAAARFFAYHTLTKAWTELNPPAIGPGTPVLSRRGDEIRAHVEGTGSLAVGLPMKKAASFGIVNYVALGTYLAVLVIVGAYFSNREHSTDDFFLGGRRIPWWAAGLSLLATQVSSIGFMAVPAKSFATDWAYFTGVATWFLVVPIVCRYYIPFFRRLNVTSAYEYLEARFHVSVRLFGTVQYSLMQLGRMAVVLYLPALALSAVTGMDQFWCIILMGVLCTLYTVLGGIEAVIWTDVLQAGLLIGGALVCVGIVIADVGGPTEFWRVAHADGKFHLGSVDWDMTQATLWAILIGNFFIRLGSLTSDQAIVQRYLTTPDEREAKGALWADIAASIPWAVIVFTLGTALYVFYKQRPEMLPPNVEADGIVPLFVMQMVPPGLSGLIVAAVFAAAMSSLDSAMHSTATIWVTDFYARFFPRATDASRLLLARILVVALGVFGTGSALWMAASDVKSIWDVFQTLVGFFGGGLTGLFVLGLFTRRAHGIGAIIGAVSSAAAVVAVAQYSRLNFFYYAAVGCLCCVGVGYLASLFIPGSPRIAGLTVYDLPRGEPER